MKKILIIIALILLASIIFVIAQTPTSQIQENSQEECLIMINGQTYDVTTLRETHPGGDIYICGSDMTQTFNSKHGSDYERLEEYLVSP